MIAARETVSVYKGNIKEIYRNCIGMSEWSEREGRLKYFSI